MSRGWWKSFLKTMSRFYFSRLDEWNNDHFPLNDDEDSPSPTLSHTDVQKWKSNQEPIKEVTSDNDHVNHSPFTQSCSFAGSTKSKPKKTTSKANKEKYETQTNQNTPKATSPLLLK